MRLKHLPRAFRYVALAAALLYAVGAYPRLAGSASKSYAPTASSAAEEISVRQINLVTNDLIVDPKTQTLYVSVPSRAGVGGNSIVHIDPKTGALATPVFVGSEPNRLAVAGDGSVLYVG